MYRKIMVLIFLFLLTTNSSADVMYYAHRGGRALWPENTLCAYEQALKLDVDFMDMDVQLSKDDVFVVTHNSGLDPNITLDDKGEWVSKKTPIRHLTLKELKQYQIVKIRQGTKYFKQFPNQRSMTNCHISSLSETIDFIKTHQNKNVGFQIEVKVPNKQIDDGTLPAKYATILFSILEAKGILERTEVQSFDFRVLAALSNLSPTLKLAFLTDKQVVAKQNDDTQRVKQENYLMLNQIRKMKGTLWEPSSDEVTNESIAQAHKLGLRVVVWGLPEKKDQELKRIRELIRFGVDGIITDNPIIKKFV